MVQSLHIAVRHIAKVTELARLSPLVFAEICRVDTILPASINLRVEVLAHLILVHATMSALGDFEHAQAQVHYLLAVEAPEQLEDILSCLDGLLLHRSCAEGEVVRGLEYSCTQLCRLVCSIILKLRHLILECFSSFKC